MDIARAGSLLLVVVGHLVMVVIDRGPDGALRGDNLLAIFPDWAWLGMLSPMPIFFAAAGWSHARRTDPDTAAQALLRVRNLAVVGGAVAVTWSVVSLVALGVAGEGNIVSDGARLAIQPLWFLAAYVPFLFLAPWLNRVALRLGMFVLTAAALVVTSDVLRFGGNWPRMVGAPGFFLVWAVPWVWGAWWRNSGPASPREERRMGVVLAAASVVGCVFLVRQAGYSPSLIDAVPGRRTNSTPPTFFTLVASLAQVGVFMCFASTLDRVAARTRRLVAVLGRAAVAVYAWHLTALALCGAALAAGVWAPQRFSSPWWWTRLPWWAVVVGLTGGFTWATAHLMESTSRASRHDAARWHLFVVVAGLTTGAVLAGVYGPRSAAAAVAIIACFATPMWIVKASRSA